MAERIVGQGSFGIVFQVSCNNLWLRYVLFGSYLLFLELVIDLFYIIHLVCARKYCTAALMCKSCAAANLISIFL